MRTAIFLHQLRGPNVGRWIHTKHGYTRPVRGGITEAIVTGRAIPNDRRSWNARPGRWMCVGWSLENFLLKAYNLRSYQLSAPRWVRSAMFTVNATMPAGTTREEFPLMQQRLLEDVSTSQYGPRHCDDGALIQPCRTATAVS
jgi:hypothetical protein